MKKPYQEMSNYEKFIMLLEEMKLILNEKICDQLLFAANRYVDEMRKEATDKVISPELQELDKLLKEYSIKCKDAKQGHGPGGKMYLDHIVKRIKEVYGS